MNFTENHPRDGFWKCYHRLRNQGEQVNHKRLHRVYKEAGLSLRRKSKKRKITRIKVSRNPKNLWKKLEYGLYE